MTSIRSVVVVVVFVLVVTPPRLPPPPPPPRGKDKGEVTIEVGTAEDDVDKMDALEDDEVGC